MDAAEAISPEQSGTRLAHFDQQKSLQNDLKALNDLADFEGKPAELDYKRALARQANATAQEKEDEAANRRRIVDALGTQAAEADPVAQLEKAAGVAASSGALNVAAKLAGKAATIRSSQATRERQQAEQAKRQYEQQMADLSLAERLYSNVKSPEEWAKANDYYKLLSGGKDSPFAQLPYSPDLAQRLTRAVMSTKDRLAADRATEKAAEEKKTAVTTRTANMARAAASNAAANLSKLRADELAKNGGPNSAAAREARETARAVNKERLIDLKDQNKGLTRENPALPPLKETYKGLGPKEIDKDKLVAGRYYTNGTKVILWNGTEAIDVTGE